MGSGRSSEEARETRSGLVVAVLLLIHALGTGGAFFFHAGICVLTFFFCMRLVPEAKGKHLEDIQAIFRKRVEAEAQP